MFKTFCFIVLFMGGSLLSACDKGKGIAHIYSFYGRLSVASTDVELFKRSNLPPTYFLYGSQEVFRSQIEACANAVRQADAPVETRMLDGLQHGFGGRGNWFEGFDTWMTEIFE